MQYLFLAKGWHIDRVWEFGGLWNEAAWRRPPLIEPLNIGMIYQDQSYGLYQLEDDILMLEIKPQDPAPATGTTNIGQVIIKRLITADQAIAQLNQAQKIILNPNTPDPSIP